MNLADILKEPILNLKNVNRYSGKFLLRPDSVAVHTLEMQGICLRIANSINNKLPLRAVKIDIKECVYRCLVHDLDEAILCDLPRNFKYCTPKFKKAVDVAVEGFLIKAYTPNLIKDIHESKRLTTIEGALVKAADIIHSTIVLREEVVILNNMGLDHTYRGNLSILGEFKQELMLQEGLNKQLQDALVEVIDDIIKDTTSELLK